MKPKELFWRIGGYVGGCVLNVLLLFTTDHAKHIPVFLWAAVYFGWRLDKEVKKIKRELFDADPSSCPIHRTTRSVWGVTIR